MNVKNCEDSVYREEEVTEALKWLKIRYKATVRQMAQMAGCSQRHMQAVLSENEVKALKSEAEYTLARLFRVDPSWFSKLGHALTQDVSLKEFNDHLDQLNIYLPGEEKDFTSPDFTTIKKAKPKLSAGNGSFVFEESVDGDYHFRTDWLSSVCSPSQCILFDVDGDSMEPTIRNKEVVLIDLGRTGLEQDKIFAVGVGDNIFLKRLHLTVSGKVEIISDNKEKFKAEIADPSEVRILGRVVWHAGLI